MGIIIPVIVTLIVCGLSILLMWWSCRRFNSMFEKKTKSIVDVYKECGYEALNPQINHIYERGNLFFNKVINLEERMVIVHPYEKNLEKIKLSYIYLKENKVVLKLDYNENNEIISKEGIIILENKFKEIMKQFK